MGEWRGRRRITYESDLDPGFAREIQATPGGDKLVGCIQCGTCSGTCPVSIYMDYTPRTLVAMTRAGFKNEVLRSFTIWLCASCYACTVECPKQIKITDFMYALKRKALAERVYPKRFPTAVMAQEFFKLVEKHGRNREGGLAVRMFLRTNPLRLFTHGGFALRLWLRGRLGMVPDTIKRVHELHAMLRALNHVKEKPGALATTGSGGEER